MNVLLLNASAKDSGATQEILRIIQDEISGRHTVRLVCLGNLHIGYCKGCKACYETGVCVQTDDMQPLTEQIDAADLLIIAAPSYWADVPGQFKVFIDRCTVYGDTNPNHPTLRAGKRCCAVSLRTGTRPTECIHIIDSIWHWCGHMQIARGDSMYFCGINGREDIAPHAAQIRANARAWLSAASIAQNDTFHG